PACLTVSSPGNSGIAGTPGAQATHGPKETPGAHGTPGPQRTPGTPTETAKPTTTPGSGGRSSWTVPSASSSTTTSILTEVQSAIDKGAKLEQLVQSCNVPAQPASARAATSTPTP